MAEALGTISAVTGIMSNIVQAVQQVETARARVRGKSQIIKNVSVQLESISQSLSLVQDEKNLHTASVEQHCMIIIRIADELKAYFDRLTTEQQRHTMRQFFSALKAGDKDEVELAEILERLDRARNELVLRISVAQVGLMGDMNQGFRVAYDVLMDTNRKCKKILGTDLQLASQLQGRKPESDGQLALDSNELRQFGLTKPLKQNIPSPPKLDITFANNVTLDQARMIMGNVGVQNWEYTAGTKVNITGNRFGNNLSLLVGDSNGAMSMQQVFG